MARQRYARRDPPSQRSLRAEKHHFAHLEVERSLSQVANRLSSPSRFEGRSDVLSVRPPGLATAPAVSAHVADYRVAHSDTSLHLP